MAGRILVALALALAFIAPAAAAQKREPTADMTPWIKTHRVVIQIDQDDPAVMNLALNNAENMKKYYEGKGEKIEIEFVAFGAGLAMMRTDKSPVKDRLMEMSQQRGVTFSGCGNTLNNQSKAENRSITLLPGARIVPTGVARITELEEQGWTYLRP